MKRFRSLSLGGKLFIVGIFVVVVPVIAVGLGAVYVANHSITHIAWEDMTHISNGLAEVLQTGLTQELRMTQNISYSNSVCAAAEKVAREGVKKSQREIAFAEVELSKIKKAGGDRYSAVTLVGKDAIVFADGSGGERRGLNLSGRAYIASALQGTANVGEMVVSRKTGRVICSVASPITARGKKEIVGAAVNTLELSYLTDIIDSVKLGRGGYSSLVDQNVLVIAHPVKENILKIFMKDVKGLEPITELVSRGGAGVREYADGRGVVKIGAVAPVPLTNWRVITIIPKAEMMAPAAQTMKLILLIGLMALALACLVFYFFARNLSRPLHRLVAAAGRIAAGDLSAEIPAESRQDEIGALARAFTRMLHSLREKAGITERIAEGDLTVPVVPQSEQDALGRALAVMAEKFRGAMAEIQGANQVLVASSSEILAAASQVAAGAAENATAVSQTTTTVEEVKQTALLSSQKAKVVAESAQKSVEVSRSGRQAVEDLVGGMERIRERMEFVAQSIVRLSEQGQAIGEIIATVNDLAEQSNLLAVNAAIEAARAGEQGKGFTVVAQEVRRLAEQSKQATAQVRGILNDVQKATSSAVMATEQGSKAVEEGVRGSARAGEAIGSLAGSIEEAYQAATQIAASSQQQLAGMDQVFLAMESVRQGSLQTAASTKQAEKAAQSLHEVGQRMRRLVERYKVV